MLSSNAQCITSKIWIAITKGSGKIVFLMAVASQFIEIKHTIRETLIKERYRRHKASISSITVMTRLSKRKIWRTTECKSNKSHKKSKATRAATTLAIFLNPNSTGKAKSSTKASFTMATGCKARDKEREDNILRILAIASKVRSQWCRKVREWAEEWAWDLYS